MNDVLPDEAPLWERFEDTARAVFAQYGYRNLRVPIVEPTALFVRGIGEHTDVVEHGDVHVRGQAQRRQPDAAPRSDRRHRARRRSSTTSCTTGRSACGRRGPMFRHERPQKGRYRQFHQLDVEALGFAGPDVDAEQIVMLARLWRALGLARHRAPRSTRSATPRERAAHRAELIAYFERHAALLDDDAKRRLHANPLRILDSKNPAMQAMIAGAPKLVDRLGDESRAHFEALQRAARRGRRAVRRSIRGWCAGSTTTTARCSSGSPMRSARRARSPAAAATTACSSSSAASRRPRADSRSASSAWCCCCATQGAADRGARRLRTSCTPARPRRTLARQRRRSAARRGPRGRRARGRRQLQVPDETSRCERRALRADHRRRGGGQRTAVAVKPLRGGEQFAVAGKRRRGALRARSRAESRNEHGSIRSRGTGTARRPQGVVDIAGAARSRRASCSSARWSSPACRAGAGTAATSAEEASALYTGASAKPSARATAHAPAKAVTQLEDKFAGTGYAPRGALLYARMLYDAGDKAGAQAAAAVGRSTTRTRTS